MAKKHTFVEAPFDVEHYRLEIDLQPEQRSIVAECRVRLIATVADLQRVELDFEGLLVDAIEDGEGHSLRFEHEDGRLSIELDEPLRIGGSTELRIAYSGSPRKGLWFAGGLDEPTHVFTQGECEDSHWWFPCVDVPSERATHEVIVSMPASWTSVAGGHRVDSKTNGDRRVDHWRTTDPHPAYLTTLVAGEFVETSGEWEGLPLAYLAEAKYAAWVADSLSETDEALAFLTDVTGTRYPYEKYSQACVENFPFGGMENISATTLTTSALSDERGLRDSPATGLVVHEAAHQWFGDLLTCKEWSHIWLNEGFATYFTNVYFERSIGVDDFRVRMRKAQNSYTKGDSGSLRRPIVHNVYRDPMDLFFGGHTYAGGATRLHLLRFVLGDKAFFRGIRTYVADNRNRSVVTADLKASLEKASGVDLEEFFDQWLESPGYPEFEVSWKYDAGNKQVLVTVDQKQGTGDGTLAAYRTPVDIEVHTEAGSRLVRRQIKRRREIFKVPAESEPVWVRFDKYGWIPKKLRSRKGLSEWLAIAQGDDDVNGRRDAVAALASGAQVAKEEERSLVLEQLIKSASSDESGAVREDALAALAELRSEPTMRILMTAGESDEVAACRVAALRALGAFGASPELAVYADEQFAAGYSWATMRAAAELYRHASPETALAQLTEWLETSSPHEGLKAGIVTQMAELTEESGLYDLAKLALEQEELQDVRVAAVRALGQHGKGSLEVSRILLGLLESSNYRLRTAALEALQELDEQSTFEELAAYYKTSVFSRERRILEKILRRRN